MPNIPWAKEFPGDITVCDADGIILEMNDGAAKTFKKDGGQALVGTNLLACHPEPSRTKVGEMLASGQTNVYMVERDGRVWRFAVGRSADRFLGEHRF